MGDAMARWSAINSTGASSGRTGKTSFWKNAASMVGSATSPSGDSCGTPGATADIMPAAVNAATATVSLRWCRRLRA
jgi:hypothetical protein